jgi:hypothetical protein
VMGVNSCFLAGWDDAACVETRKRSSPELIPGEKLTHHGPFYGLWVHLTRGR